MSNKISNVRFEQINSIRKDYSEVRATFLLDGKEETYYIFTKSKSPIKEAKKIFDEDLKAGLVAKSIKSASRTTRPILISACALLGAAVIALSSVLIYKTVNGGNVQPEPQPEPTPDPEYLNNPIKITSYQDGELTTEQTITYNDDWYRTGSISKAYDIDTGELESTTEEKFILDEKNRITEGERITKDASGEMIQKNIQKCTFETDNKGTEYVEDQRYLDGVIVEIRSSYDEYENTYSVEGKKVVDSGEDLYYRGDILIEKKTRTSEGVIGNKGYDSPSKAEAVRYSYNYETGDLESRQELSTETLRKYVDETHEELTRINIEKDYNEDGSLKNESFELLIGSVESNKKGSSIYEEFYNYADKDAKELTGGTMSEYKYDDLNRPIASVAYKLDIKSTEEEKWNVNSTAYYLYHANENQAYLTTNTSISGKNVSASVIYREFDKYGRVTYLEAISGSGKSGKKSTTKYEYGDPIPVNPDIDNLY